MGPRAARRWGVAQLLTPVALLLALLVAACGPAPAFPSPAAQWGTWVLEGPEAVTVPPPPATEPELHALGSAEDAERLADDLAIWPWLQLALEGVAARTKDPPAGSRAYALVAVATHDAVVAALHWQQVHAASRDGYPAVQTAIAGAAWPVLAHQFPEQPTARFERLALLVAAQAAEAGQPSAAVAGLELGRAVADRVIAYAEGADADEEWNGQRPTGPGLWEPPPGSVAVPVAPLAGTWGTWVLERQDQFRPPAPLEYASPSYLEQAQEVVDVRDALTAEQRRIAEFWEGGEGTELPPGIWIQAANGYVRNARLELPQAARVMAAVAVALDDGGVSAWEAKYHWWTTRPVNAIRDLGLDPDWEPYLDTPLFPSYTSGHAVYSGAAAEVLAHFFPDDAATVRARAEEAAVSRLYGGIHFRMDNDHGLEQGRRVGQAVVARLSGGGR